MHEKLLYLNFNGRNGIYLGNEKVIELLILHGANIAALNNDNETALHWAALNCKS